MTRSGKQLKFVIGEQIDSTERVDKTAETISASEVLSRTKVLAFNASIEATIAMREVRRSATHTGDRFRKLDSEIVQLDRTVQTL